MIELKTSGELEAMREAGRIVAGALAAVGTVAEVGTELRELDEVAAGVIGDAGARPSFLHYHPHWAPSPFPRVVCTSVNDVIVHGIPDDYRLADGDLLSVDCGAHIDGWHADAAVSFIVGAARQEDETLMATAQQALDDGIAAARPGGRLGDISHAVGVVCRSAGYGIPGGMGGHGVGRAMHEAPEVPNDGRPGRGLPLRPGLVVAIEPMLLAGGRDSHEVAADGWAVRTDDGTRAAHVEHTVAITGDGPVVLTAR